MVELETVSLQTCLWLIALFCYCSLTRLPGRGTYLCPLVSSLDALGHSASQWRTNSLHNKLWGSLQNWVDAEDRCVISMIQKTTVP